MAGGSLGLAFRLLASGLPRTFGRFAALLLCCVPAVGYGFTRRGVALLFN